ncbi:TPA: P22AR C-terminal domain-containing protein [Haemophilus influenzae]|uniref:P22AR C-terminal domain-containing protein n=1 Tax=Haemophilus influenzae TaxID=727 RepID=UPI000DD45755|nr:P22AR C-terminal domain-containing protein [Haemophilus influenzae]MCK9061049.1 ORF6C domain-containing protein [Haemophilus influenzae]MCK9080432.1 ORF6C domain-containing protein [Haemophilus influenzae]MCK9117843.1 ORF6C domain-containing protein [Haemophilus influenzae]
MTTLTFQNTTLSVINQNNQTFLTASDLGKALDYSDSDRSVRRLYTANADEFTTEMTALVEMQTAGGLQKVRIFSLRGAHLIAMFARTKVAKDFRKWVLDVLDEEVKKSTALLPNTITPEQQQAIQSAVQQAHHRTGLHWQEIYRQLKAMFHIAKYDQLPQDQYGNAMAFIMNLQPIVLPSVEKKFTCEFTEHDLQQLVWAWFALLRGTELCQVLHPALKQIGSHYAASVYGVAYEYRSTLRHAHNVLTRITEQFECEQGNNWRVLKHLRAYNPKATGFQLDIL